VTILVFHSTTTEYSAFNSSASYGISRISW